MKKKKKNPSKKTLGNKCEKLCREIIRLRDKGQCRVCGSRNFVQMHHIVYRRNLHLKYDLRNLILLCSKHHDMGAESAHHDTFWWNDFLDATIPDIVEYLRKEKNIKEFNFDYEDKLEELTKTLTLYKN